VEGIGLIASDTIFCDMNNGIANFQKLVLSLGGDDDGSFWHSDGDLLHSYFAVVVVL
jgi:hypothetical protein